MMNRLKLFAPSFRYQAMVPGILTGCHKIDIAIFVQIACDDGVRSIRLGIDIHSREVSAAIILIPDKRVSQITGGQHVRISVAVDVGRRGPGKRHSDSPSSTRVTRNPIPVVLIPEHNAFFVVGGNDVDIAVSVQVGPQGDVRPFDLVVNGLLCEAIHAGDKSRRVTSAHPPSASPLRYWKRLDRQRHDT